MHNQEKGIHRSYGIAWTDVLEQDAEEMAWRSFLLLCAICFAFIGACCFVIFDIVPP